MENDNLIDDSKKLSHKQWRAQLKKQKRKVRRTMLAKEQPQLHPDSEEENCVTDKEEVEEEKRQRAHALWEEREKAAQLAWKEKKEWEERERQRQAEEERQIKEEWEERVRREKEEAEKELKESEERKAKQVTAMRPEDAVKALLTEATSNEKSTGEWHNPIAPKEFSNERPICPFFAKVGACRFGDRCSRTHEVPDQSTTLLFSAMYSHFAIDQGLFDEYDSDLSLEYEDRDVMQHFREFYEDVVPEFSAHGRLVQFKVCCNYEPHLRGNVYVQYASEEDAGRCFGAFNGRWYGGRQLNCQYCGVTQWKNAICGLFSRKKCPKGRACNFLHVFQNPGNKFWEADRDVPRSQAHSRRQRSRSRESRGCSTMRSGSDEFRGHSRRRSRESRDCSRRSRSRESKGYSRRSRSRESRGRLTRRSRSRESRGHSTRRSRSRESKGILGRSRSRESRGRLTRRSRSRESRGHSTRRSRSRESKGILRRSRSRESRGHSTRRSRSRESRGRSMRRSRSRESTDHLTKRSRSRESKCRSSQHKKKKSKKHKKSKAKRLTLEGAEINNISLEVQ